MDKRRQQKISSVIKEAFTDILLREGKGIFGTAFVTVTHVTVTSDLTLARFYLSVFNVEKKENVLELIQGSDRELKKLLGEKLRHQLRRIPEFEYYLDDSLDQAYKIEEIFQQINKERDK